MPTRSDAGRRWLTKALHPAEASIKAPKAPGASRYPTTVQEVVSTFQIYPPSGLTTADTWDFRVVTHTDPLCPLEVFSNRTGSTDETLAGCYFNQAFLKSTDAFKLHSNEEVEAIYHAFQQACETYRVNALSTTGVFVGPTVEDQGSVLASQFIDSTRDYSYSPGSGMIYGPIANLWVDKLPAMSEASMGQRPYISDARNGWYCPQKLDQPGHWARTNDVALRGRVVAPDNPAEITNASVVRWPQTLTQSVGTTLWPRLYDNSACQIFVKGLSIHTSFRVTVRLVLEMGVTPSNDFAPFASDPAPPDPVAYELYTSICNELMDGYPSDYNDLGKIWGKIKNVASKVAGFIDPIAGIASAAGVPFAKAIQGIARGVSSNPTKFINAEEDGLKAAIASIKADKAKMDIAQAMKAKAKLSTEQRVAAQKAAAVINRGSKAARAAAAAAVARRRASAAAAAKMEKY